MNPNLLPKVRSKPIMQAASGKNCTVRISSFLPGHRCSGNNTVVGAHLPVVGKGVSTKATDMAVVFACHNCHAIIDRVDTKASDYIEENYLAAATMRLLNALVETHAILLDEGLVVVPGARIV